MAVAMASGSLRLNPAARPAGEYCLPRTAAAAAAAAIRCCSLSYFSPFGAPMLSKIRLCSDADITVSRAASPTAIEDGSSNETGTIPIPKVIIDQDSDPDATIVEVTFGDRLGTLLDTMKSLKNLGLNVVKANVYLDSSGKHNKFVITSASTGRKVTDPELLEAIRLTIINNMLEYHPESSSQLAMGAAFGVEPPKQENASIGLSMICLLMKPSIAHCNLEDLKWLQANSS